MFVRFPCDIFISVKVFPLLCFQNSKVRISALENERKSIAFDPRGIAFTKSYSVTLCLK
jgi:hypothetical protein